MYHEAGHLISGRRGRIVLEELDYEHDGDDERAANEIARDMLIPGADLETFLETGRIERRTIKAFASSQGIAAGIVVGRLQRDGIIVRPK